MKKGILVLATLALAVNKPANAQVKVDINIGRPAVPVVVASAPVQDVSYYYLPEAEAYYHIPAKRYYYYDDGAWVSRSYLPGKYRSSNAYSMRHVAIREPRPYRNHDYYRNRYSIRPASYSHRDKGKFKEKKSKERGHKGKGHAHGHHK